MNHYTNSTDQYQYIDVAFGGTNKRNHIIQVSELKDEARKWKENNKKPFTDCYRSYWLFPDAMLDHFNKKKSVGGYDGPVYAEFLRIDVDSTNLNESLENAQAILGAWERAGVDLEVVHIYFSGMKGFHLEIPSKLFGFEPSQFLNAIHKEVACQITPPAIPIDSAVYDKPRLWRLPNTINSKSGLYKIPLTVDELFSLTIEEIRELAKAPRREITFDDNVEINTALRQLYLEAKENAVKQNGRQRGNGRDEKYYDKLFDGKPIHEGEGRNKALFSYGCKLRAKGLSIDDIALILSGLNATRCNPPFDKKEFEDVLKSVARYETENKTSEFKTLSWMELIGKEEPEIEFLIEGLLPAGTLLLLAGKPKQGKSLLSLLLSLSVGLGQELWDKKVQKGAVLFVSTEDGEIRLKKRIWKMSGNPGAYKPDFYFHCGPFVMTDPGAFESFRAKVLEIKPRLIVLDPFINLFRKKEINSATDMNEVLRPFQELAKETGACILIIAHTRKMDAEDAIDMIQGSATIGGVPDGIMVLKSLRRKDEKMASLEVKLKDAEDPEMMVLRLDESLKWGDVGAYEAVMAETLENDIVKVLEEEPDGLPIATLMAILDVKYPGLYNALREMEKTGTIISKKAGKSHSKTYRLKTMSNEKSEKSEKSDESEKAKNDDEDPSLFSEKAKKSDEKSEKSEIINRTHSINTDSKPSLFRFFAFTQHTPKSEEKSENGHRNGDSRFFDGGCEEKAKKSEDSAEANLESFIKTVAIGNGLTKLDYDRASGTLVVERDGKKHVVFDFEPEFQEYMRHFEGGLQ